MKMAESSPKGYLTLREKGKLLVTISPFPTVFSKDLECRHLKTRACLGKGYHAIHVYNHVGVLAIVN